MRKQILFAILVMASASIFSISCKKDIGHEQKAVEDEETATAGEDGRNGSASLYNLDVDLCGQGNRKGHIKFRQNPDPAKIVTLDTKVRHLQPNRQYLLQRAVDQTIDGNCTGTAWLTLGKGLVPQSILTNVQGKGREELWRDLTAIPTGSVFDIHFQVVDATNMAVVLTSGCYQYTVR